MSNIVDVHCHVSPFEFPAAPSTECHDHWPCMMCNSPVDATMIIGGKPFRKLDNRSWDVTKRLEDMEADNIAVQVLSPMPELLSYWLSINDTLSMCDYMNGYIAEMVAREPTRFRGFGTVPLQDPDVAAKYLARCKNEFKLSGIQVGSNINGCFLGESRFDPFYEAAQELDIPIFIHALHPVAAKAINASVFFSGFACFPLDVAMCASSIIMNGTLERFPGLRLGFSHGGGALGSILGRLDAGWELSSGFEANVTRKPSEIAGDMFYDSNVFERSYLDYLISNISPGKIFVGTDYPYAIAQKNPHGFISSLDLDRADDESIRFRAAEVFLGADLLPIT